MSKFTVKIYEGEKQISEIKSYAVIVTGTNNSAIAVEADLIEQIILYARVQDVTAQLENKIIKITRGTITPDELQRIVSVIKNDTTTLDIAINNLTGNSRIN